MTNKPSTAEAMIAITEKKMDMTLDDIIKMSKKAPLEPKKTSRRPIKGPVVVNSNGFQRTAKVQRYMDSRSSIRQGVLAQRRSNYHDNQFQATKEVARKAAIAPILSRAINRNRPRVAAPLVQRKAGDGRVNGKDKATAKQGPLTLDARFADIKQQRMRALSQQNRRFQQQQRQQQQQRGKGGSGTGRWFGKRN